MEFNAKLRTCLWFSEHGEDAAAFYVGLVPDSRIDQVVRPDPASPPLVIEFTLAGAPMMILNAPGGDPFTNAVSLSVLTEDQAETDRLWATLSEGGAEGRCGWLRDRFGVAWQIVPKALPRLLSSGDPAAVARVQAAMMAMAEIEIAALERAHRG